MTNTAERLMVRLTLEGKRTHLPAATGFVRQILSGQGLSAEDAGRMELAVEEACVHVIENAFEGEPGSYDLLIFRRPGQIVVGVEDRGLPLDYRKLEEGGESGLGLLLMRALADEVRFVNLGRLGKRVELVKNLPERGIGALLEEGEAAGPLSRPLQGDIAIRLMRPDEALNLARCAYRCYGYTYATDLFYYPERVGELLESGLMTSCVAVDASGEIVGHVAVTRERPDALVGEDVAAVVDPRCRGRGLLDRMAAHIAEVMKARGMLGTYVEGVTVHDYSQKSLLANGSRETGLLLGYTPASMQFKAIPGEESRGRRPVVIFYQRKNPEPPRPVYPPARHAGMLARIYGHNGLNRALLSAAVPELPGRARVDVRVQTEASRAFLRVAAYGRDLEEVVRFRLRELCSRRVDLICLDLPLHHPAVQHGCASLEALGFFFGGVFPELADGDCLRLQYLNHAALELDEVQLASGFAKELFRYVLAAGPLA